MKKLTSTMLEYILEPLKVENTFMLTLLLRTEMWSMELLCHYLSTNISKPLAYLFMVSLMKNKQAKRMKKESDLLALQFASKLTSASDDTLRSLRKQLAKILRARKIRRISRKISRFFSGIKHVFKK